MSDEIPVDEYRADYYRLRDSGEDKDIAKAKAIEIAQSRRDARPGKVASFVRGAAQGGSFGFGDEIAGALGAVASSVGALPNKEGLGFGDAYRQYRDEARAGDKEAKAENPKTFFAGQLVGGAATAPIIPLGAVKTAGQAAIVGAKIGAAAGLGGSEADTSGGDIGGALIDTATGAVIGAGLGAVAHKAIPAIGRGVANMWGKIRGTPSLERQISSRVAQEAPAAARSAAPEAAPSPIVKQAANLARKTAAEADQPSSIGQGLTVRQAVKKGQDVQKWAGEAIDEPAIMFPHQMAGDRAGALAQESAAQYGPAMNSIQSVQRQQLQQATRVADAVTDRIAASPGSLSSPAVAKNFGGAIRAEAEAMHGARSAAAGPEFAAFEQTGGGIGNNNTIAAFDELQLEPSQIPGKIKGMIDRMRASGAGGGWSVREANELRKVTLGVIRGQDELMTGGVGRTVQSFKASQILKAIDADLSAAEGSTAAPGVEHLRRANAIWRHYSNEIDNRLTDHVLKILDRSEGDASESLAGLIAKAKPEQQRAVFRIVRGRDPAAARDMLAQIVEDEFVSSGKASRLDAFNPEDGIQLMGPGQLLGAVKKLSPIVSTLAKEEPGIMQQWAMLRQYAARVAHGPNTKGSPTYARQGIAMDAIREGVGEISAAGKQTLAAAEGIKKRLDSSAKDFASALMTADGVRTLNIALEIRLFEQAGRSMPPALAAKLVSAASRAGIPATAGMPQPSRVLPGFARGPGGRLTLDTPIQTDDPRRAMNQGDQ